MITIRGTAKAVALALLGAATLAAQDKGSAAVHQAEERWVTAIKGKDKAALETILSDDLVYTHSTGLVEDKSQYIGSLTSGNQKYDDVTYEDTSLRVYGTTAVVATKAVMKGSTKGVPFDNKLRLLHVWVKQRGKWVLVAHQTTRLP